MTRARLVSSLNAAALGALLCVTAPTVASAAPYDFSGDGRADLVVGDPGEAIGSKIEAGAVNVVYGSATGLASARNQLWSQSSKGVPGSPEAGERFGSSLAGGTSTATAAPTS